MCKTVPSHIVLIFIDVMGSTSRLRLLQTQTRLACVSVTLSQRRVCSHKISLRWFARLVMIVLVVMIVWLNGLVHG